MGTGGGAATSSGIDFQSRLGALVMLSMLSDLSTLVSHGLGAGEHRVERLRFETNDDVDDLVAVTDGPTLFMQAKRSLSLSEAPDSEYASVIRQFTAQYATDSGHSAVYLLATTPRASSKITRDLKKLTEAARLNELGLSTNPLNKPEQEVLDTTYRLIGTGFARAVGRDITKAERDAIFERIHVTSLELEAGGSYERAVLTVLASLVAIDPMLVWANLVNLSLTLAKDRLSVDNEYLTARFGRYFAAPDQTVKIDGREALSVIVADALSAAREVLFVDGGDKYLLAELYRFAEDGSKRVRFVDGFAELPNGIRWKVLHRTATFRGMERILLAESDPLTRPEVVIMPINSDEDYEDGSWAKAHADLCLGLAQANQDLLTCLTCARPISEDHAPIVEVDEDGQPHQVGLVHTACLQPMHRMLGAISNDLFRDYPSLADFDYKTWLATLPTGQGMFNGLNPASLSWLNHMGWKPGRTHLDIGRWGVTYTLDDGNRLYVSERGHVQRFSMEAAMEAAESFTTAMDQAEAEGDPFCSSPVTKAFGTYSVLLKSQPEHQPVKIVSFTAEPLTRATLIAHRVCDNYYAPLVALIDASTGDAFSLGGATVLLTDPLRLRDFTANWTAAQITLPDLATSVVHSDDQFDALVANEILQGNGVVVDPKLSLKGEPISGIVFNYLPSLLHDAYESTKASAATTGRETTREDDI